MPVAALTLALSSAVLHAVWNLLLGRARDVQAATAATFVLSVLVVLPFALAWWHAEPSVWPWALASTLLEAVYAAALAVSYRRGEVSVVYPLTRGAAPVLALLFGAVALGHHVSGPEAIGIVLVGAGVVAVRGRGGSLDARGLALAAALAATIAGYTLVDRVGIHRAGALAYFVLTLVGPCVVLPPLVGVRAMRRELGLPVGAAAAANVGSFVLGLLALRHGSAAGVLAVRSASVVLATAFAARVLHEHVSRWRLLGSVVVFAGIALIAV